MHESEFWSSLQEAAQKLQSSKSNKDQLLSNLFSKLVGLEIFPELTPYTQFEDNWDTHLDRQNDHYTEALKIFGLISQLSIPGEVVSEPLLMMLNAAEIILMNIVANEIFVELIMLYQTTKWSDETIYLHVLLHNYLEETIPGYHSFDANDALDSKRLSFDQRHKLVQDWLHIHIETKKSTNRKEVYKEYQAYLISLYTSAIRVSVPSLS
jgi:hypothetical protein